MITPTFWAAVWHYLRTAYWIGECVRVVLAFVLITAWVLIFLLAFD